MEGKEWYGAAYKGSKQYDQWEVPTANATGFGAAADDYMERGIDLNEELISNKPATFFFRMNSDAMTGAGIFNGDTLIVDRSIPLTDGKIIIAILDGDLLVRRFYKKMQQVVLAAENSKYADIPLIGFSERTHVWGIVTYAIHATL